MKTFLMIGQSNMAGRGELGVLPPILNDQVTVLRGEAWIPAEEPVNPDRVFSGESMQVSFADCVQRALGEPVGLIPCAEGGTLLYQWAPGSELFERAVHQAQIAAASHELCGILWIQGENDGYSEENAKAYEGKFLTMLDALVKAIPVREDIPVIVAQLCPFLDDYNRQVSPEKQVPYHRIISATLRDLPLKRLNIRCVDPQGLCGKPDGIHYDTPSLRELGRRFAQTYLSMVQ